MALIPVLGRRKQEEFDLEINLGYTANPWVKTDKQNQPQGQWTLQVLKEVTVGVPNYFCLLPANSQNTLKPTNLTPVNGVHGMTY